MTVPVFDGRHRYDLVFTDVGRQTLNPESGQNFEGVATACKMTRYNRSVVRAGIRIDRGCASHLDRLGCHQAAGGGDLFAAAANPTTTQHPRGALLDATAGQLGFPDRCRMCSGSTDRHRWVRAGPRA